MKNTCLATLLMLFFVASSPLNSIKAVSQIDAAQFTLPDFAISGIPLQLYATWYHIFKTVEVKMGTPILDLQGRMIGPNISKRDWCMGAIEGTMLIKLTNNTSKTFNFAGVGLTEQVNCRPNVRSAGSWIEQTAKSRFGIAKGPFGDGVAGFVLVPYRTIAVDKNKIPYGTVCYVPAAKGITITLPSGKKVTHDGYFFAGDTGGAIRDNHIDVFAGILDQNPFPNFVKSQTSAQFAAYVVNDKNIIAALKTLHRP